jgi:hypothetical protein
MAKVALAAIFVSDISQLVDKKQCLMKLHSNFSISIGNCNSLLRKPVMVVKKILIGV